MNKDFALALISELGDKAYRYLSIPIYSEMFKECGKDLSAEFVQKWAESLSMIDRFAVAQLPQITKEIAIALLKKSQYSISVSSWIGKHCLSYTQEELIEVASAYDFTDANENYHFQSLCRSNVIGDDFVRTFEDKVQSLEDIAKNAEGISDGYRNELKERLGLDKKAAKKRELLRQYSDNVLRRIKGEEEEDDGVFEESYAYEVMTRDLSESYDTIFEDDTCKVIMDYGFGYIFKFDKGIQKVVDYTRIYEPHNASITGDGKIVITGHETTMVINPITFEAEGFATR